MSWSLPLPCSVFGSCTTNGAVPSSCTCIRMYTGHITSHHVRFCVYIELKKADWHANMANEVISFQYLLLTQANALANSWMM